MTSADIADRILNYSSPMKTYDPVQLSHLIQQHHDAVVEECAALVERAPRVSFKGWNEASYFAAEIRALKGCA